MKVNDMDKQQLTNSIEIARKRINDPEANFHFHGPDKDNVLKILDEINNPVTDKEGYIQKYYLSDEAKSFIELILKKV